MDIKIPNDIIRLFNKKDRDLFGLKEIDDHWKKYQEVDLNGFTLGTVKRLAEAVKPFEKIRGGKILLKDIEMWVALIEKNEGFIPRKCEQFKTIITEMIGKHQGHRVYRKYSVDENSWLCYYVNEIGYEPPHENSRGDRSPCYTWIDLIWEQYGVRQQQTVSFYDEDCVGLKPELALMEKDIYFETPALREDYLANKKRYYEIIPHIGRQFLARGIAFDDADGNRSRRENSWYWRETKKIIMDKTGDPSKVVCDLFFEEEKSRDERDAHLKLWFWTSKSNLFAPDEKQAVDPKELSHDGQEKDDLPAEDIMERPIIEIPVHPIVVIFDLRRQTRLTTHCKNLTEYVYDEKLGEKLILPKETTNLINMLLHHKGVFADIVKGKGGGVIVLCSGGAGTGKTLTAEVYCEVTKRPLYSVQASQLGIKPEYLEEELLKVFTRAQRWGAILLLDEADVYVHRRGESLYQNAIVGVFLRVLEYYNGVMFMTTNRGQDVDDAIASRCIARIDYKIPTRENQKKIWRVLADVMGVELSDSRIISIVNKHKKLSGRDIKNLLKLGKLVCDANKQPLSVETIDFVCQFKPTESLIPPATPASIDGTVNPAGAEDNNDE